MLGCRGMGALEFEPVTCKESLSYAIELSDLIETTKALLAGKENLTIQTKENMEDVMMGVLKMETSAEDARPKAIIAYNEKIGKIKSAQTLMDDGFEHRLIMLDEVSDV